jgi:hypothetical protein
MRGKTIVRYAALATVLFLQSGASAQAVYFSATGTFAAANGQFEDFNFTLPGTLSTTLKTLAWSGGTNAAGQTVAAGGIDSILSLYNGSGTLLYSNDDANDGNASTRDSVLSPTGTGSSLIPPLGAGNYRLRMTNFQSSIGDGHWATDLTVPASSTFTLTGITGSGNSTLSALYFGSSGLGTATFLLNPGTTVSAGLVNVQDGGILNLNGGTLLGGNENIFGNNASALQNGGLNAPFRLQVGPIGAGTYTLNAGTLVTTTLVKIGDNNSAGIFIQNGGTVQATTDLLIGSNGNSSGTYTLNAGSLSTSDVLIASSATDSGTFNQLGGAVSGLSLVVGGSSAITNSPGGNGYCALFTGATATFTDTVKIYGNGLLNITGGTLNAGTIDNTGGGFFFFNSGTLHLTGSNVTIGSTGVLGANPNLSFNRNLVVDGTTTIQSGAALTINGGYFSSGAISNSGSIQFTSGTLRLSNSSLTVGNSGLLGNVVQLNSAQHVDVVGNAIVNNGALLYLSGGSLTASNFATVAQLGDCEQWADRRQRADRRQSQQYQHGGDPGRCVGPPGVQRRRWQQRHLQPLWGHDGVY